MIGVRRQNVARYEAHVAKLVNRSGFIDLFWPGVLLVEQIPTEASQSVCDHLNRKRDWESYSD